MARPDSQRRRPESSLPWKAYPALASHGYFIVLSSPGNTVVTERVCPVEASVMEDLTRFALALLSAPVVIVTGGVVLGLIGRYVTGRR